MASIQRLAVLSLSVFATLAIAQQTAPSDPPPGYLPDHRHHHPSAGCYLSDHNHHRSGLHRTGSHDQERNESTEETAEGAGEGRGCPRQSREGQSPCAQAGKQVRRRNRKGQLSSVVVPPPTYKKIVLAKRCGGSSQGIAIWASNISRETFVVARPRREMNPVLLSDQFFSRSVTIAQELAQYGTDTANGDFQKRPSHAWFTPPARPSV